MTDTIPEAVIEAMCAGGSMYGHPLPLPRARIAGALQAAQALGWLPSPDTPPLRRPSGHTKRSCSPQGKGRSALAARDASRH